MTNIEIKSSPILPKVDKKFNFKQECFQNKPKSPQIVSWATFVWKLANKNFKKSPNLVALFASRVCNNHSVRITNVFVVLRKVVHGKVTQQQALMYRHPSIRSLIGNLPQMSQNMRQFLVNFQSLQRQYKGWFTWAADSCVYTEIGNFQFFCTAYFCFSHMHQMQLVWIRLNFHNINKLIWLYLTLP